MNDMFDQPEAARRAGPVPTDIKAGTVPSSAAVPPSDRMPTPLSTQASAPMPVAATSPAPATSRPSPAPVVDGTEQIVHSEHPSMAAEGSRTTDQGSSRPNRDLTSSEPSRVAYNGGSPTQRPNDVPPVVPSAVPNSSTTVGTLPTHNPSLVVFPYPNDTEEELDKIAAEIRSLRPASIPEQQARANKSRILGLLKRNMHVKEIREHLFQKNCIDPKKVTYKQFADQVKKLRQKPVDNVKKPRQQSS